MPTIEEVRSTGSRGVKPDPGLEKTRGFAIMKAKSAELRPSRLYGGLLWISFVSILAVGTLAILKLFAE